MFSSVDVKQKYGAKILALCVKSQRIKSWCSRDTLTHLFFNRSIFPDLFQVRLLQIRPVPKSKHSGVVVARVFHIEPFNDVFIMLMHAKNTEWKSILHICRVGIPRPLFLKFWFLMVNFLWKYARKQKKVSLFLKTVYCCCRWMILFTL